MVSLFRDLVNHCEADRGDPGEHTNIGDARDTNRFEDFGNDRDVDLIVEEVGHSVCQGSERIQERIHDNSNGKLSSLSSDLSLYWLGASKVAPSLRVQSIRSASFQPR